MTVKVIREVGPAGALGRQRTLHLSAAEALKQLDEQTVDVYRTGGHTVTVFNISDVQVEVSLDIDGGYDNFEGDEVTDLCIVVKFEPDDSDDSLVDFEQVLMRAVRFNLDHPKTSFDEKVLDASRRIADAFDKKAADDADSATDYS